MAKHKIVITGGPSTGKTSIINHLENIGETCLPEISRSIILEAKKQGIDQLFLEQPTLFSEKLLEGRVNQFTEAKNKQEERVFIDRGIPDILAYMSYVKEANPSEFVTASTTYRYDSVFLLPPWKKIHITDNERYESYEQAEEIYNHLLNTYSNFGYNCIEVPFGTVTERSNFILDTLSK